MRDDPQLEAQRAQIAELDLAILAALNRRIQLVQRLKAHKEAQGLAFHDPGQESRLLARLVAANPGPLSREGLEAVFSTILAWAKREATRTEEPPRD